MKPFSLNDLVGLSNGHDVGTTNLVAVLVFGKLSVLLKVLHCRIYAVYFAGQKNVI